MQAFVARQPILNRRNLTVGFELLHRDGPENIFPKGVEESVATSRLMSSTLFNEGIGYFTMGKPALINFGYDAIVKGLPGLLPPERVVIEILENAEPDHFLYGACKDLVRNGYKLALDDFVLSKPWQRFLPLVKMVKFDIQKTPLESLHKVLNVFRNSSNKNVRGIKLLAERIETAEEYNLAREMGFDYFQGYYFSRPHIVTTEDSPIRHAGLLAVYAEVMREDSRVDVLDKLFKQDPGLTYKLLTYLNSGIFQAGTEINSVKTAILYLGQINMRRFVSLLITASLDAGKPNYLVHESILRARFCELLASRCNRSMQEDAFFVGLLSLLDALLDRPLGQILEKINVGAAIKEALTMKDESVSFAGGFLSNILDVVKIHETGNWEDLQTRCRELNLDEAIVPGVHAEAIRWTADFVGLVRPEDDNPYAKLG